MNLYQIIKKPIITEKSSLLKELQNRYLFSVDLQASKPQIKAAVEKMFKVKVLDVHTAVFRGKLRRVGRNSGKRSNWKKAIVTLNIGDKIEFFENV